MFLRLGLAAIAAAMLVAPSAAPAALVSGGAGEYRVQAGPGETNEISAYLNDGALVFYDKGAALSPGAGCHPHPSDDGGVECTVTDIKVTRVDFELGDGNDKLDTTRLRHWFRPYPHGTYDGGDGNDAILQGAFGPNPDTTGLTTRGGSGDDKLRGGGILDGGPGNDEVRGPMAYSHERIEGGDGDDNLDGGPGMDDVSGGPGADTMYEGGDYYEGALPYDLYDMARLDGGDGNDRMATGGYESSIAGGPGDDEILSAVPAADGGEGNDMMRGGPVLRGGPGDDTLIGGSATQPRSYPPGTRTDVLDGGPGRDSLRGGGRDGLLDGGADADTLEPGPAHDTISYRTRETPVRVDLRNPGGEGGVDGEGDTIAPGFERLEGSRGDDEFIAGAEPMQVDGWLGDDVIVGGPGNDTLDGGGDHDVIVGAGGADKLYGGIDSYADPKNERRTVKAPGFDTIDGGPGGDLIMPRGGEDYVTGGSGDDFVDLRENAGPRPGSTPINYSHIIQMSGADQVWCGKGRDHVEGDYADDMATDCEAASEGTPRWRSVKVRPGREIRLTVRCAWGDDYPCKGIASFRTASGLPVGDGAAANLPAYRGAPEGCRVKKPGAVLARESFRIRAGRVNYIHMKLSRSAERTVRRRGCMTINALLSFRDVQGREWLAVRSLLLRRAG